MHRTRCPRPCHSKARGKKTNWNRSQESMRVSECQRLCFFEAFFSRVFLKVIFIHKYFIFFFFKGCNKVLLFYFAIGALLLFHSNSVHSSIDVELRGTKTTSLSNVPERPRNEKCRVYLSCRWTHFLFKWTGHFFCVVIARLALEKGT